MVRARPQLWAGRKGLGMLGGPRWGAGGRVLLELHLGQAGDGAPASLLGSINVCCRIQRGNKLNIERGL